MYSVSADYLAAMRKKVRCDSISGTLTLADGTTISISDENLVAGSMKLEKALCGSEYRIGSFNLACLRFSFFIDSALGLDLTGAEIELGYTLEVGENAYETVPLGTFYADPVLSERRKNVLTITAYDAGAKADIAPSQALKSMASTAAQLIIAACAECGIATDITAASLDSLPNSNVPVTAKDKQIQSCRDIIMWCSKLLCSYAVIGRDGKLMIIPAKYAVSDTDSSVIIADRIIREDERDSITVTDTRAYRKYLTAYKGSDTVSYTSAYTPTDEQASPAAYALEMNPLLCEASENVCDAVNRSWLGYIDSFKQRGVKTVTYGDPALDIGDTVMFRGGDVDQRSGIIGIVTSFEWVYRGYQSLECTAAECVGSIAPRNVVSNKYRPQSHKLIDAVNSSGGGGSGGVGEKIPESPNQSAERFNDYREYTIDGENSTGGNFSTGLNDHVEGYGNHGIGGSNNHYAGSGNYGYNCSGLDIGGYTNKAKNCNSTVVRGVGNDVNSAAYSAIFGNNLYVGGATNVLALGAGIIAGQIHDSLFIQSTGGQSTGNIGYAISIGDMNKILGNCAQLAVFGGSNTVTNSGNGSFVAGYENTLTGRRGILLGSGGVIDDNNPYVFAIGRSPGSGNGFSMDEYGNVYALGSYNTMGADYAEYFEWADGNPENEDRRGWLVALDGDKIVPADGNGFFGIVSSAPSVVGNSAEFHWKGKYVTDAFGAPVTDDNGKPVISDDYAPERKYTPRSQRYEWAAVGLMGRLIVTDDGSCTVGSCCTADNGRARKWAAKTKARVIKRIDDSHVEVLLR